LLVPKKGGSGGSASQVFAKEDAKVQFEVQDVYLDFNSCEKKGWEAGLSRG
jgi:hypothetical protein